ncbi:putative bifunctional diguanylate cyclase/phosphodiesterase [Stutzerimonas azotifigens]|uniref:putative bifunctional diguanylate cyclase/phosphodiesterase n=1 Tax=Stutzerimonas azotifigens TaxID=291995 RepID=UPI000406F227|nr:sensor domain-containing phosphodiesterase [Stutzerimonas azotifigens]
MLIVPASSPTNDIERLYRIRELGLHDAPGDTAFDRLVELAAHQFRVPIAAISILDRDRIWFLAQVGVPAQEISRSAPYSHPVRPGDLFEIDDARQDPRFRDNPLVTGEPGIRFHASMPLVTDDGIALGGLCLADTRPHPPMTPHERESLRLLTELVMERLYSLRRQRFIDRQSGLFNRQQLQTDVSGLLGRGERLLVAVVDPFAPSFLNELVKALGHGFASDLLLAVKAHLQALLPREATLYKLGPSRFGFVLRGERLRRPEPLFDALAASVQLPVGAEGIPLTVRAGLGALCLDPTEPEPGDWLRSVISTADEARERDSGWNWYDPSLDLAQQRAFHLLGSLAEAVDGQAQLHLHYQPRIDLATGACTSVEALLRWQHPELGTIGPAEFIPLAEKTALMRSLSLWVLRHAIVQLARWRAAGHDFRVAINISAGDLENPQFTDRMLELLDRHGVEAHYLEVEFTESALMRKPEVVRQQLGRLREMGVEVAIDDFGSGYSNWNYLRALPASSVKLDRSLLRDLADPADRRLTRTIIELARELGYRVVAEGIETPETQALVHAWGCHEGQGFLFARPMPATALAGWLAAQDAPPA